MFNASVPNVMGIRGDRPGEGRNSIPVESINKSAILGCRHHVNTFLSEGGDPSHIQRDEIADFHPESHRTQLGS